VSRAGAPGGTGGDGVLVALAGLVAAGGVCWLAGAASARLAGHGVPSGRPAAGLAAFAHPGNPARAWGGPVGPVWLYWSVTAALIAVAALVATVGWRVWHTPAGKPGRDAARQDGMGGRGDVRKAAGRQALLSRSAQLRPSLSRPTPADVGYRLGTAARVAVWASVEDSMLVLGPPRSGKGMNLVIPAILDAPGAVVTTSTRPDNLAITATARAAVGPVMVFDPQGLAAATGGDRLRWSLTRGWSLSGSLCKGRSVHLLID
jgi:type IV secretion system protein VirD4